MLLLNLDLTVFIEVLLLKSDVSLGLLDANGVIFLDSDLTFSV